MASAAASAESAVEVDDGDGVPVTKRGGGRCACPTTRPVLRAHWTSLRSRSAHPTPLSRHPTSPGPRDVIAPANAFFRAPRRRRGRRTRTRRGGRSRPARSKGRKVPAARGPAGTSGIAADAVTAGISRARACASGPCWWASSAAPRTERTNRGRHFGLRSAWPSSQDANAAPSNARPRAARGRP